VFGAARKDVWKMITKPELWAARDPDGTLWFFPAEPIVDADGTFVMSRKVKELGFGADYIDSRFLPEIEPGEKCKLILL
jgi:hypothetical protein